MQGMLGVHPCPKLTETGLKGINDGNSTSFRSKREPPSVVKDQILSKLMMGQWEDCLVTWEVTNQLCYQSNRDGIGLNWYDDGEDHRPYRDHRMLTMFTNTTVTS